ncbi:trehalose-phosphatase [Sphingomonas aurantiaca]|uniref:Trehalose 6-phosphate phosphatase n=1 Tax=Sphingomonas aurantiaca TaxID=185949 RepID=A0A2T5GPH6_9SPHN|nr:trehalose-phosphatase [Sphingomonas aurantiaca]PTQ61241.1 trehalose 6-phosphatase [Sphingomonas aurantiaca]
MMLAERQPATEVLAPPPVALDPPPVALDTVSLFFDFDGTLVDLAATPDAVVVDQRLRDALDSLAERYPGRVAIISGRSIEQLDSMLGDHARRFAVAGSHGAERRTPEDGHVAAERPASLEAAAEEFAAFAAANGLVYEAKSLGAGLHYRMAPAFEPDAVALAETLADRHGLTLQRGKMMVELRTPGDKGAALRSLIDAPTMAGTTPYFFGDDVTDEDGFEAARDLGGAGVLIGDARPTAATYRLNDVAALRDWIAAILETR